MILPFVFRSKNSGCYRTARLAPRPSSEPPMVGGPRAGDASGRVSDQRRAVPAIPEASRFCVSASFFRFASAGRSASDIDAIGGLGRLLRFGFPSRAASRSAILAAASVALVGREVVAPANELVRQVLLRRRRRPRSRGGSGIPRRSRAASSADPRPCAGGLGPPSDPRGGRPQGQRSTRRRSGSLRRQWRCRPWPGPSRTAPRAARSSRAPGPPPPRPAGPADRRCRRPPRR